MADRPGTSGQRFSPTMTPTAGVDPRVALATSMHAAPGVYAVLVGSGMSSAAGIPTGWQVVQDLIRKVALVEGADPTELDGEPERWWARQGRGEPRYDTLLPALASTDAARQLLLRQYFEPSPQLGSRAQPTAGHQALAALCASGRVRIVLTTNFDRLIERALDQAGSLPQVIASGTALAGMTPLCHAATTIVKLHGDYASLGLRNTPEELAKYPVDLNQLLARVFDEYGLVVVGWSAEYDTALAAALEACPSRRYPTYWVSFHGNLSEPAQRLIAKRDACVIETTGADEFLGDLVQKIGRLDQVAARRTRPSPLRHYILPPESTAIPQGWAVLPLLQLRSAALVAPASLETCGLLRADNRDRLRTALRSAPFTNRVRSMALHPSASALTEPPNPQAELPPSVPGDWEPTPDGYQSTEACTYRLGGDATSGISALVKINFPGFGRASDAVVLTADVALSLAGPLRLAEAARILGDGLVLVTSLVPEALADILPIDSAVTLGEVHFLASMQDGKQGSRENDVATRVDLSSLGKQTRAIGQSMGFSARLAGPLTDREALELLCDALDYLAYTVGYLDPRLGLQMLRQELGMPSQAHSGSSG